MQDISDIIKNEYIPDEGIYKITQHLFDLVHNIIPDSIQNIPAEVMIYGFAGSYGLTKGLQYISKNIVDKIMPCFHDKMLPILERICEFGIPGYLFMYALSDPEEFTFLAYNKPLDNLGILMAYLGGVVAAEQDLYRRKN